MHTCKISTLINFFQLQSIKKKHLFQAGTDINLFHFIGFQYFVVIIFKSIWNAKYFISL